MRERLIEIEKLIIKKLLRVFKENRGHKLEEFYNIFEDIDSIPAYFSFNEIYEEVVNEMDIEISKLYKEYIELKLKLLYGIDVEFELYIFDDCLKHCRLFSYIENFLDESYCDDDEFMYKLCSFNIKNLT